MLAADKLQLQSQLKQQATALKEKEFNLHHSNLMTVGTQAAVLAGLDITMFIEFNPPMNEAWGVEMQNVARCIKFIYYITIVSAFCANMLVVSHTTALSVLGAGMALRGPDGSMMTATDGLYEERKIVFTTFGIGLACTVGSLVLGVWLLLHWEAAILCMGATVYTCVKIWTNYLRVQRRFDYDESETVDFTDIMSGPASIRAMPAKFRPGRMGRAMNGGTGVSRSRPTRSTSAPLIEGNSSDENDQGGYYYYSNGNDENEPMLDVELQETHGKSGEVKHRRNASPSSPQYHIQTI